MHFLMDFFIDLPLHVYTFPHGFQYVFAYASPIYFLLDFPMDLLMPFLRLSLWMFYAFAYAFPMYILMDFLYGFA